MKPNLLPALVRAVLATKGKARQSAVLALVIYTAYLVGCSTAQENITVTGTDCAALDVRLESERKKAEAGPVTPRVAY